MEAILNVLKVISFWIGLFFLFFLYVGIKTLKSHVVSIGKIFILPLVFVVWSIWDLVFEFQGGMDIFIWLIFLAIGSVAGWGTMQPHPIRADHKKMQVKIPGSPFILVLICIFFPMKYFFNHVENAQMALLIHFLENIVTSAVAGIFIGRTIVILKKFAKAKHEKLKKS